MIAILWSLLGALSYGLSDFVGGVAARQSSAWPVAFMTSCGAVLAATLTALTDSGSPDVATFAWAALAGVGGGLGIAFLYRGFALGRVGVVAPTSAVCAAAIPIVFAVIIGEHPSALTWTGIVVALPGIWMVSFNPGDRIWGPELGDGLRAGIGFGASFVGLGHISDDAGWWPLVLANASAAIVIVLVAVALRQWERPNRSAVGYGLLGGALSALAMVAIIMSSNLGLLSITAVLVSLYPAVTILLAVSLLGERIHRAQARGLILCATAVALVALSGQK